MRLSPLAPLRLFPFPVHPEGIPALHSGLQLPGIFLSPYYTENMNNVDLVTVFVAQGEIEEDQVRSFLLAHDIPTSARGEALRHTHSFQIDGLGQVEIQVAEADALKAKELLEQVARGDFALTVDEAP